MVTIEMSSLSENHLLAAILANGHMITAVVSNKDGSVPNPVRAGF